MSLRRKNGENLRELFLKYILQIERNIRSLLSYYFTEKFGADQSFYLDSTNYITEKKHQADVARLIGTMEKLANHNTDYPYINHQCAAYGNVPLWVLFNGITFGTLSKFYSLITQDLRIKTSKNFASVNEKQLEQYLSVITKFRNVCAHNERLYSYQTKNDIPNTVLHAKLSIPQKGTQYIYGKHDLFALVIAFRYLLPNEDFKKFKICLNRIITHYLHSQSSISESELLNYRLPLKIHKIRRKKNQIPIVSGLIFHHLEFLEVTFMNWLYTGDPAMRRISDGLMRFVTDSQITEGVHKGMVRWSPSSPFCYADDDARGMLLPALRRAFFGDKTYLPQALDGLEFLLRTTGTDGLRFSRADFKAEERDGYTYMGCVQDEKTRKWSYTGDPQSGETVTAAELRAMPAANPSAHYNATYAFYRIIHKSVFLGLQEDARDAGAAPVSVSVPAG